MKQFLDLNKIFLRKIGKPISSSLLRSIFVSHKYNGNNKLTNNKMDLKEHKETISRFKKLAGIIKEEEKKDEGHGYSMEELKAMMEEKDNEGKMMNESLFAAIGGLVGVLGAAGVTSAIEMALEDPAIAEKYPKLAKVFEFLSKVGGAVGKGIK